MTERQGGSDVRANITRAEPVGDGALRAARPQVVLLVSAVRRVPRAGPGARRALVLPGRARARDGVPAAQGQARNALAAFLRSRVPRCFGRLVGEEGRGVPAIIRMVNHTRLDCLLGAATGMRRGAIEAIHHARHRAAFGAPLVEQPAMQQRARRPGDRVRGGHRRGAAGGPRLRRARRGARSAGSPPRS